MLENNLTKQLFRVENKVINIAFSPFVVNAVDKYDTYSLLTEGKTKVKNICMCTNFLLIFFLSCIYSMK